MVDYNKYFCVKPAIYVRELMSIWMWKYLWLIALPLIVFIVLGCYDTRWLIVALMMLMIVLPGVMLIVYFNFALTPDTARRTLPQSISVSDSGINLTYLPHPESGYTPEAEHVTFADIKAIDDTGMYLILRLRQSPYSIIILPASASGAKETLQSWHNFC